MALSTNVKNFTAGSIVLADSGASNSMTLDFDQGEFKLGPLKSIMNVVTPYERRGRFKSAAYGEREYPAGSFTSMVAQFTDASASVVTDFVLKRNNFSGNVSTLGTGTKTPYAIDITFNLEGTDTADSVDHTFVCHDCIVTMDEFAEGDPDTVSFSFIVLGEIASDLAVDELPA